MKTLAELITLEIPKANALDVEFLGKLREAHNHNSLKEVGAAIEQAFNDRVSYEFVNEEITPNIRARITDFCVYLIDIAKFYGFALPVGKLIASTHGDMYAVRTNPSHRLSALIEATFTYFNTEGCYKITANGFMRIDWITAPNDPVSRREQIRRDNNDRLPGLDYDDDSEKYYIHVEIAGQFPLLIPV